MLNGIGLYGSFLNKALRLLFLFIVFSGCVSVFLFSPAAYEQATSLKVESLALMARRRMAVALHPIPKAMKGKERVIYAVGYGR